MSNYSSNSDSKLVYSTDGGRVREEPPAPVAVGDGNVRVW